VRKPFGPFSRLCHVPDDLESVTTRGAETEPGVADLDRDDVERLWHAVEAVYRTGLHPALQVCMRYDNHPVLHRAIGFAHGNDPDEPRRRRRRPWLSTRPSSSIPPRRRSPRFSC
jgi:hypothetical protein